MNRKPLVRWVAGMSVLAGLVPATANATILALDDFGYNPASAPVNELNTRSGGGSFGFSTAWTAVTDRSGVVSPGLTHPDVSSSGNAAQIGRIGGAVTTEAVANRPFTSPITQSSLFVSLLITQTAGTLGSGDDAYIWLGGTGATTDTFARIGFFGASGNEIGAQAYNSGGSFTIRTTDGQVAVGTTYHILARLTKIGGVGAADPYDKIEIWNNPQLVPELGCTLENPDNSIEITGSYSSLSQLGFGGRSLESGDLFSVDRLMVFDDIDDLGLSCEAVIPEASTYLSGALVMGMFGWRHLRRNRGETQVNPA